jgi:hypothetical protein
MDFVLVEIAAAAVGIAAAPAEMDSVEAGTEIDSVEMDLPGMDLPPEAVESESFAASPGQLKSSGCSDSAIQMGC